MRRTPIVLSIAGSDNTGGAGIQADLKTCCRFGVYAATVITGVTSQNSKAVFGVETVSDKMLRSQIDAIYEVMKPDAVKTGMLPSPSVISTVAEKLKEYDVCNIVVDPVMVATNGGSLVAPGEDTVEEFRRSLLPLATVFTPNIPEASRFLGRDIADENPEEVCRSLLATTGSKAVLLKGGHSYSGNASDFLFDGSKLTVFESERFATRNTHGTGCTLSSAIACGLAAGQPLDEAVRNAKRFVTDAIIGAMDLEITVGPGPLDFFA